MLTSKARLEFERTIGNGDCSLNASALGFIHRSFQDRFANYLNYAHIDPDLKFAKFIRLTAKELNVEETWYGVIYTLLNLRDQDKLKLQKTLAPIFRTLIVDMMEYDEANIERTLRNVETVFRNEICKLAGITVLVLSDDDTTSKVSEFKNQINFFSKYVIQELNRSGFPIEEYNTLNLKRSSKVEKLTQTEIERLNILSKNLDHLFVPYVDLIRDWWKLGVNSGYKLYINYLRKDGIWLSDLELSYLAAYFLIDLDVYRDNFFYSIYINSVSIPKNLLSARQIEQLRLRGGVLDKEKETKDSLVFSPFASATELKKRLSGLDPSTIEFFSRCKKEGKNINQTVVPDFIIDSTEELHSRNISERRTNKEGISQEFFIVDEINKAYERSLEVFEYETIVDWWEKHFYPVPKIRLSNPVTTPGYEHYENILPNEEDITWPFTFKSMAHLLKLPKIKPTASLAEVEKKKGIYYALTVWTAAVAFHNLKEESISIAADKYPSPILSSHGFFNKDVANKSRITAEQTNRKRRELDML